MFVDLFLLQVDLLSSESSDLNKSKKFNAYIKHPYLCVMDFEYAALILMRIPGRSLDEILKVKIDAARLREKWRKDASVRRISCQDVGLSALNLIETTNWAHSDIRNPIITWNSETNSFCLINFDSCTKQVKECTILRGID